MSKLALGLLSVQLLAGATGQQIFKSHCAGCHGGDARGSGKGPGLAANPRLAGQSAEQLQALIRRGFPDSGMPPIDLPAAELAAVAGYVRSLNLQAAAANLPTRPRITWHAPQPGDWLTYNGNLNGNRYSELSQIHTHNVAALRLQWIYTIPYFGLETTPIEADGVMYVTGANQVSAIDALTGAELWKYSRPPTHGLDGDAALGTNRGAAIREDRVFFVTDNAHLVALDRATGELVWEKAMPEESQHYGGTLAPL
ncbi:MAG TPA: PQQ-binding-like beta-propeller repeat protein, partial [Bryobacteraceae bacterium]|nr:PQQ-binding-like beta-propeller repeat protein [Bryobacteraceae bacterium]